MDIDEDLITTKIVNDYYIFVPAACVAKNTQWRRRRRCGVAVYDKFTSIMGNRVSDFESH